MDSMEKLVEVGNFEELADGILNQIRDPINYSSHEIDKIYSIEYALKKYKKIFKI